MHQLPRHAEYKDSGLSWVGAIPSHWQTRRNRFLFREIDSRSAHGEETHLSMSQAHGLLPSKSLSRKSLQSENYAGGKLVAENDLVLNRLKAHLGVFARAKQSGVVSPDYSVFRPKGEAAVQYCEALFKTPMYVAEFRRRTKGIVEGFWRLYTDDFYDVQSLLPPKDEQDQIVVYLRAQDAHVARFIKAKRDLIGLLIEQKLRIIDHAVTRGLDASVRLKPSGIEWLGDVPEHWEVLRIKNVVQESDERTTSGAEQLLSLSRHRGLVPFDSLSSRPPSAKDFSKYKLCRPGQLVMNRMQAWSGLFADAARVGLISPDYSIFYVSGRTSARFLAFLFKTKKYVTQFAISSTGIGTGFNRLYTPKFGAISLALPPIEEQEEICIRIASDCKPLDEAIQRTEEEIRLIREYRDRLIADVVTGQVDVRGWVPGPDDVVTEDDLAALDDDEETDADGENDDGDD
jgi:type I restriction enzyme S subunit